MTQKEREDLAKKKMVPIDPGIPGLPGVPELPGIPRQKGAKPRLTRGYAEGGEVEGESDLIKKLRSMLMGRNSALTQDYENAQIADSVDTSSDTAKGYAKGGMVRTTSGDWDKIKDWVTAKDKGPVKHEPLPEAPGFAAGGAIPGEIDLQQLQQGLQQAPQMPPIAPTMGVPAPNPVPAAPITPQPQQAPNAAQIMGGGAADRTALAAQLANRGTGDRLATIGGGIGDALVRSSGVGQSNFMGDIQGRQDRRETMGLENFDKNLALNKEQFSLQQQLEAKDPTSETSRKAQMAARPLLLQIGFKDADIAQMPASLLGELLGTGVGLKKAESEADMAAATLGLNTQRLTSDIENRKAEAQAREEREKLGAAETLAKRGIFQRVGDALFANPATQALEQRAGLNPDPFANVPTPTEGKTKSGTRFKVIQ